MTHKEIYRGLRTDLSRKLFTRATKAGFKFRNRVFYGNFKRGYVACRDGYGKGVCPYVDPPHKVTFRKGMARWWNLGYDFALWTARPDLYGKPDQPLPKTKPKPIKAAGAGRTFKRGRR